jgi:hypothetical protein
MVIYIEQYMTSVNHKCATQTFLTKNEWCPFWANYADMQKNGGKLPSRRLAAFLAGVAGAFVLYLERRYYAGEAWPALGPAMP